MLHSVFFALMVGSDANGGTGQGGASPATSASSAEVVQDQRAADMITEAVDQVRSDWKKWTAGPYRVLLQSEAYKMNVAEWEIGMHEWRTCRMRCCSSSWIRLEEISPTRRT